MDNEKVTVLDSFVPRWYQRDVYKALEQDGFRKILLLWPRRGGKDITAWNLAIRQCLTKVCVVYYALPTFAHARRVIFEGIAIDGKKFLEFCPKELVSSINSAELKVTFFNGSILRLIGANSYDSAIVGTNIYGLVISEGALMDDLDSIYAFFRPIIAANGGWVIIQSTPRGKNALFHLYETALTLDDWYVSKLTAEQTLHIPAHILEQERKEMDEGLFAQEYLTSFERGQQGLIYGYCIDKMKNDGRFSVVNHDPMLLTHLAIDIGVSDATAIIWFQATSDLGSIRIIDCYSNSGLGLDHYAKIIQDKPYTMGKMFAPHDMEVREWASQAMTRTHKARQLGLDFIVLKQHLIEDGIENVLSYFPKMWINSQTCQSLMDALENYKREWDDQKRVYKPKPLHNWSSHFADGIRYLAASLEHLKPKKSLDEINRTRRQALYGNSNRFSGMPEQFRR